MRRALHVLCAVHVAAAVACWWWFAFTYDPNGPYRQTPLYAAEAATGIATVTGLASVLWYTDQKNRRLR